MARIQPSNTSFVNETTIHGVREAWRNNNIFIRTLWIFILLLCFFGVNYEIYRIVIYYQSNPSASQVKWITKDTYEYPPMIFCPKTFISMEKVEQLNMSTSALAYTVAMFQDVHKSKLPPDFNLDLARLELQNIIKRENFTSYMELFEAIVFDGSDIMFDVVNKKPAHLDVYVPGYGLCYRLHLPPVKASSIKITEKIELEHLPSENVTQFDFIHGTSLIVRDITGIKADMILLSKKAVYQIDFQVQMHKRLSIPGKECLGPSQLSDNYYVSDCEFNCMHLEKYTSGCIDCLPYQLLDGVNGTVEPCTLFTDDDDGIEQTISERCKEDEVISRSRKCLSLCIPVCEQWIYKHSTLIFDNYNSSIFLKFLYNPSDGILTYEEVPTYTFDTFISNVGGQLGLWLGASVVSIFQIFYYACMSIFRREKKSVYKL